MNGKETGYYADGLSDGHAEAQATIDRLTAQLALAVEKQRTLFDAIAHGDEVHREWLKAAIDHYFDDPTDPDIAAAVQAMQAGRWVLSEGWLAAQIALRLPTKMRSEVKEIADAIIALLKGAQ